MSRQVDAEFETLLQRFVEKTISYANARARVVPSTFRRQQSRGLGGGGGTGYVGSGSLGTALWESDLHWEGPEAMIASDTEGGIELGVGADIGEYTLAGSRMYIDTFDVRPADGFYNGTAECSVKGTWCGTVVFKWHYAVQPGSGGQGI